MNLIKRLLTTSLLVLFIACGNESVVIPESVQLTPNIQSAIELNVAEKVVKIPAVTPTPAVTPLSKGYKDTYNIAVVLATEFAKSQCVFFEGIVDGNQVIYIQEYKVTENINPVIISENFSKYWVFIDYSPTKSSSLDAIRIEKITEFFTKNDGKNLPKHTTYIYDASSYSREAEFVVDLNDKTVQLNNGFCYIDQLDFTNTLIPTTGSNTLTTELTTTVTPIPTAEPIKVMPTPTATSDVSTPTLKFIPRIAQSKYPVWGKHCSGSGPVMFVNSPMRIEDINYLTPYGNVVGGHITPIDHMYFEPKDRSLGRDAYEVRAIQDAIIYDIAPRDTSAETNKEQAREWRIDMAHTCTFTSYFDLLTSVAPDIEKEWERTLKNDEARWNGIQVRAGQLIGYIGAQSLDFGVYDYEIVLPGFINPSAYDSREPWKIHTVDPFQYFPSEIKDALLAKMIRAVEPRAGKIDYDVNGTLSGNWFQQNTDWYMGVNQRKYWEGHLSISPHQIDPTLWRIGIGFLDTDDNNFVIVGEQNPLQVSVSSSPVYYELMRYYTYIPAKPEKKWWNELFIEGEVFGVKIFPESVGTVLLDLEDNGLLRVEVFLGKSRDEIFGFTSNSRVYQR